MDSAQKTKDMIKKLNKIIQFTLLHESYYQNFLHRAEDLLHQLNDKEFRITVVGEFSAGKSTFLNALIGKDVLPHAVNETTATVTYIKNVPSNHPQCNQMMVEFFGNREPIVTAIPENVDGLTNYVTTMAKGLNVVEEVSAVTLFVSFPYTDEPIVFVDTPGLNGVAEGHYERTRYEIQRAHTSIYLLHTRGLSQSNVEMYELLRQYQSSFLFVINAIDTLKASEGETVEWKVQELRQQLTKIGVTTDPSIFGVSALLALTAKDPSITQLYEGDTESLTDERRAQLLEKSRFPEIESAIWDRLINSDKEQLKLENIEQKFNRLIEEIKLEFEEQVAMYEIEVDEPKLNEIDMRLTLAKKSHDDNLRNVENYITARKSDTRNLILKKVDEDVATIFTELESEINTNIADLGKKTDSPEKLVEAVKINIKRALQKKEDGIAKAYPSITADLLADLYEGAILRIENYYPKISIAQQKVNFDIKLEKANLDDLSMLQKIKRKQTEKTSAESQYKQVTEEYHEARKEFSILESETQRIERRHDETVRSWKREMDNLGSRPKVETHTETYSVEVSSINPLRKWFNRPKYEKRRRTVEDTSARDRWDEQKSRIKQEYDQKERELSSRLDGLQRRLQRAQSDTMQNESRVNTYKHSIGSLKRELDILERETKQIYEKNKQLYYNKQKREMLRVLEQYLFQDLKRHYREAVDRAITSEVKKIETLVQKQYKQSYEMYTTKLTKLKRQLLNQSEPAERKEAEKRLKAVMKILS